MESSTAADLTVDEKYQIEQYTKIANFAHHVISGKHPRVKPCEESMDDLKLALMNDDTKSSGSIQPLEIFYAEEHLIIPSEFFNFEYTADYYKVLGLDYPASMTAVSCAYRKLALTHDPHSNAPGAAGKYNWIGKDIEVFQTMQRTWNEIQCACKVLLNDKDKADYDDGRQRLLQLMEQMPAIPRVYNDSIKYPVFPPVPVPRNISEHLPITRIQRSHVHLAQMCQKASRKLQADDLQKESIFRQAFCESAIRGITVEDQDVDFARNYYRDLNVGNQFDQLAIRSQLDSSVVLQLAFINKMTDMDLKKTNPISEQVALQQSWNKSIKAFMILSSPRLRDLYHEGMRGAVRHRQNSEPMKTKATNHLIPPSGPRLLNVVVGRPREELMQNLRMQKEHLNREAERAASGNSLGQRLPPVAPRMMLGRSVTSQTASNPPTAPRMMLNQVSVSRPIATQTKSQGLPTLQGLTVGPPPGRILPSVAVPAATGQKRKASAVDERLPVRQGLVVGPPPQGHVLPSVAVSAAAGHKRKASAVDEGLPSPAKKKQKVGCKKKKKSQKATPSEETMSGGPKGKKQGGGGKQTGGHVGAKPKGGGKITGKVQNKDEKGDASKNKKTGKGAKGNKGVKDIQPPQRRESKRLKNQGKKN